MGRLYEFAEFKIDRKSDNHGWTFTRPGEAKKECPHLSLLFDENGHTVECKDCGKEVSAWWAFMCVVQRYKNEWDKLNAAKAALAAAEKRILTHKAAIAVEDAWRRRNLVPTCPHCNKPVLPCDRFGGSGVGRPYATDAKAMVLRPNLTLVEPDEAGE